MQTAVDCNGSSSNTTTISTTITTTTTENDNNTNGTMTQQQQHHHHHYHQEQPHSLMQATPETENRNILRHRVNTTTANTNSGTKDSAITATKNGLSHLIDAAEYMGSNVECMSATPSPSPQASPSKGSQLLKAESSKLATADDGLPTITIPTPLQDTYKQTNTSSESSSSKTASNSTSTTSSVIATPVLKRNGNIFKDKESQDQDIFEDNIENLKVAVDATAVEGGGREGNASNSVAKMPDATAEVGKKYRECNNMQLLTNQMLPFENTSSTTITNNKKELSSNSLPMSSSSTTSLSITTPATAATTPSTPSSSSLISSSSASTTSSNTPASATTTPALLSTPSSSSSSSSASSPTASSCSASSSAPPSPSSPESKIKDLSISGLVEAELLQWQDMPQYLQFNPYVLKGYRPLQTFKGCLLSLFYWHNETINILTHGK